MELLLPFRVILKLLLLLVFTFQYGATATLIPVLYILLYHQFTFQYGATATIYSFNEILLEAFIYIPIWSYCYSPLTTV